MTHFKLALMPGGEAVNSPRVEKVCGTGTLTSPHLSKAHTMLRAGKALRFTPAEVVAYRSLGIDFDGSRTQDDIEQALATWAQTLDRERPDLLDKIVAEMAKARGVKPPTKLERVLNVAPSSGSPRQS